MVFQVRLKLLTNSSKSRVGILSFLVGGVVIVVRLINVQLTMGCHLRFYAFSKIHSYICSWI